MVWWCGVVVWWWMQTRQRKYYWAAEDNRPNETAVGSGRPNDAASLTLLVDVVKCFERITLLQVWYCATNEGLPSR